MVLDFKGILIKFSNRMGYIIWYSWFVGIFQKVTICRSPYAYFFMVWCIINQTWISWIFLTIFCCYSGIFRKCSIILKKDEKDNLYGYNIIKPYNTACGYYKFDLPKKFVTLVLDPRCYILIFLSCRAESEYVSVRL